MAETAEKIIEQVASSPAIAIDKTLDASRQLAQAVGDQPQVKKAREYWHILGPGLTTGAADDDPSGIATYSQAGSSAGFQFLWLAPLTFPLMAIIQEMCARIGLVTGKGLAANIRQFFPRSLLISVTILLFLANVFNLGADLGAMANATQLLFPGLDFTLLVIAFTAFSLIFQIFTTYKNYARYLKFLALILFSYILSAIAIPDLDWGYILRAAITPSFQISRDQILLITGILGTTISPYLFFWQPAQEVEEEIMRGKTTLRMRQVTTTDQEITHMRIDVWSGMFISNLVMFFIILTCSATLYQAGITNIATASDAAAALRPLAGENAYILFALGIIGAGLLAVPVLAGSASYAVAEAFHWKYGLYKKLHEASAFYGVIVISMGLGLAINFLGFDPIRILLYSAVANGIIAPVVLFFIVIISSSRRIMGRWANHPFITFMGWVVTLLMTFTALAAVYTLLF